jgi:hypothetical protein
MKLDGLGTISVEEAKEMMDFAFGMEKQAKENEAYEVEIELEGMVIRTDVKHVAQLMKELQKVGS